MVQRRLAVYDLYSKGVPPEVIASQLDTKAQFIRKDIKLLQNILLRYYAEPKPQHTFVRYAAFQMGLIDKLNDTYLSYSSDSQVKQYSAAISALKAQSDIYDKVIDRGIEFGVITRRQATTPITHEADDLKVELRQQIHTLTILLDRVEQDPSHNPRREKKKYNVRSRHTRIVKKVLRDGLGIVSSVRDWKYRADSVITQAVIRLQSNAVHRDLDVQEAHDDLLVLARRIAKPIVSITESGNQVEVVPTVDARRKKEPEWLVEPSRVQDDADTE